MKDIIIDCFAGGGGASVGIEMALGRSIDIAINHDPDAIAMHMKNHPDTLHLTEDMLKVDLRKYLKKGQRVRMIWASPDCTSHSRAKGDKPIKRGLRILPMGVYRLCKQILEVTGYLPEVVMMENVAEIQDWGPLDENDKPIKERKGEYYKKFIKLMKNLGFRFECKELVAADYGAHTTRKRWYAVFRSDDKQIVWPVPTHNRYGTNGLKKWEPIADYINFNDLGKSIFGRKKPLADKTMNRIGAGMDKFVFNSKEPFIVQVNHGGDNFRGQSIHEPITTITQKHGYGVVTPYIMQIGQTGFSKDRNRSVTDPMSTVVTKNEHCLISPMLIQYHSETSKSGVRGQSVKDPIMTIDTSPRYALVAAFLTKFYKTGIGQSLFEPIHTITTSAGHFGQVSILAVDYKQLIANGVDAETAQKCTWVSQFIMEYYGCGIGQSLNDPLHTVVTKDRFALITVLGNEYAILDIYLRMLDAEELKLGQEFPKDYIINFTMKNGKPYPKSEQVKRIGNSVVPTMSKVLAEANCYYLRVGERIGNIQIDDSRQQLRFA
jgi:DNA (cytosine-5)-methyltransferase 1